MGSHNHPHFCCYNLIPTLGVNNEDSFTFHLFEFTRDPKLLFKRDCTLITWLRDAQSSKLKGKINVVGAQKYQVYGITEEGPAEAMQDKKAGTPIDF